MRLTPITGAVVTGLLAGLGFLAVAAATVSRQSSSPSRMNAADVRAERCVAAVPANGMVVAVDPETGELGMPSQSQLGTSMSIEAAQAFARQVAAGLVTVHHPDGSSTLIHDDRLADYATVRLGSDGRPVFGCVHGLEAASAVETRTAAPAALEER
jgi:hypothetical protein